MLRIQSPQLLDDVRAAVDVGGQTAQMNLDTTVVPVLIVGDTNSSGANVEAHQGHVGYTFTAAGPNGSWFQLRPGSLPVRLLRLTIVNGGAAQEFQWGLFETPIGTPAASLTAQSLDSEWGLYAGATGNMPGLTTLYYGQQVPPAAGLYAGYMRLGADANYTIDFPTPVYLDVGTCFEVISRTLASFAAVYALIEEVTESA